MRNYGNLGEPESLKSIMHSELHWHKTAEVRTPAPKVPFPVTNNLVYSGATSLRLAIRFSAPLTCQHVAQFTRHYQGSVQVTSVNQNGQNFVSTVVSITADSRQRESIDGVLLSQGAGDLWYFPAGIPHSLQATNADPAGAEFLLVSTSFSQFRAIL